MEDKRPSKKLAALPTESELVSFEHGAAGQYVVGFPPSLVPQTLD